MWSSCFLYTMETAKGIADVLLFRQFSEPLDQEVNAWCSAHCLPVVFQRTTKIQCVCNFQIWRNGSSLSIYRKTASYLKRQVKISFTLLGMITKFKDKQQISLHKLWKKIIICYFKTFSVERCYQQLKLRQTSTYFLSWQIHHIFS